MTSASVLRRRADRLVRAATLVLGLFTAHQVAGATPGPASPSTADPRLAATAPAASAPGSEAAYARECGDCHLAYAPRLLPAAAWRQIMAGLDRHFGVDASLDPPAAAAISAWLARQDASPDRAPREKRDTNGAAPRITTTQWFIHEHREVPAATWRSAAVGSAARCAACHTDAGQGRFSEHALRIPNQERRP